MVQFAVSGDSTVAGYPYKSKWKILEAMANEAIHFLPSFELKVIELCYQWFKNFKCGEEGGITLDDQSYPKEKLSRMGFKSIIS